jgi:hypothetical protein
MSGDFIAPAVPFGNVPEVARHRQRMPPMTVANLRAAERQDFASLREPQSVAVVGFEKSFVFILYIYLKL